MKFIMDSGASANIITSLHNKELNLNNVNSVRLAGLGDVQEEDVIKEINGVNTTRLSLTDLIEYFQEKKGDSIQMRVERDSVLKDLNFNMDTKLTQDT